jgi:hypothetical protein
MFFNAHHAPIGAFASFTLGFPGNKGGLGLELGGPANQNIYIGAESHTPRVFDALPFYAMGDWESDAKLHKPPAGGVLVRPFPRADIKRTFQISTDAWQAGDLTFRILSPFQGIPNPETARKEDLQLALAPAVLAELTLDNTHHAHARKAFFGFTGTDPYSAMRCIEPHQENHVKGIAQGRLMGILSRDKNVHVAQGHSPETILAATHEEDMQVGLGSTGLLWMVAPPHRRQTVRFAICFYRDGIVTAGMDTRYYYTQLFKNLEDVGAFALDHFIVLADRAAEADKRVAQSRLSPDQKFMVAHSAHSYYGSTQLLARDEKPVWVVNEGEYRMMNTLDLSVDHLFFETAMNPWVVRNVLDLFLERYNYHDRVCFPDNPREYPGGITFTHDMGVANCFSRPGFSAYEQPHLRGCFSYMSHEELVNWICCAGMYAARSADTAWTKQHKSLFMDLLTSLLHRDHPNPARRNGIMKLDSSRAMGGSEITTYDSLDPALGQARSSLYLAVKSWAAYVSLEKILSGLHLDRAASQASDQARRGALTIASRLTSKGYIPALIDEKNDAAVLCAVEGLAFPYACGWRDVVALDGPYSEFIQALKKHLQTVLVKGLCLFENGAWKISASSDNTWLSKIYLNQFVSRQILRIPWNKDGRDADAVHASWLLDEENAYYAWSDQMANGKAVGSRYYPRGITSFLWLLEDNPSGLRAKGPAA